MGQFCAVAVLVGCAFSAWAVENPGGQSIGLVLTGWHIAMREPLDEKVECPDGLVLPNSKQHQAQFASAAEREAWINRYGDPRIRGRHGEDVSHFPESVEDPLPYREVQSPIAQGLDLDGGKLGEGPARPLAHEEFISPTGEPGIDNQLYRAIGCQMGWRKSGLQEEDSQRRLALDLRARVLFLINGIDDSHNDADVTVTIMKGMDKLVKDASGAYLPHYTQRVDAAFPQYVHVTQGRIEDGILITEPIDILHMPIMNGTHVHDRVIYGFRMRLKLDEAGAAGIAGGYEDLAAHWRIVTRPFASVFEIGSWSAPSYWRVLHRLADGYPDPETGKATAISAGYRVEMVQAYIVDAPAVSIDEPLNVEDLLEVSTDGLQVAEVP